MSSLRILCLAALAAALIATASAAASTVDHRGRVPVCHGGWVEDAPADRPNAPAYVGDVFIVERRAYATVHHTNGQTEHFAKGKLVHRDKSTVKPVVYHGWISTHALHCS